MTPGKVVHPVNLRGGAHGRKRLLLPWLDLEIAWPRDHRVQPRRHEQRVITAETLQERKKRGLVRRHAGKHFLHRHKQPDLALSSRQAVTPEKRLPYHGHVALKIVAAAERPLPNTCQPQINTVGAPPDQFYPWDR